MHNLILLAQQSRYDRALSFFRWGVTGIGVAFLIGAAAPFFSKFHPKKELSPVVSAIFAAVCATLGLGIICYAWLGRLD